MTIKVIGKRHMEGTSKKNGNPYNMNEVHYTGKARGVDGLAAKTLLLQERDYPFSDIYVNADYFVEFDERGYPVEFSRVIAAQGK